MKTALMWLLFVALASGGTFKPTYEKANRSEVAIGQSLLERDLLLTRQYCDTGYGLCDSGGCCPLSSGCCGDGCINLQNTCCYGYACPAGSGCCGTEGYCRPSGYGCCGTEGYVYPLDGSDCCSDGGHCPPGSSCVRCDSDPSEICCLGDDGDYVNPAYGTDIASVTYPSSTEEDPTYTSTDYSTTSFSDSYTTSTYTYTYVDYDYYYLTYTYYFISWYPRYTPTTSTTVTTTTVLSVYASDSADARRSLAASTRSVESDVSFSESLYSPATVAATQTQTVQASSDSSSGGGTSGAINGRVGLTGWVFAGLTMVVGGLAFAL